MTHLEEARATLLATLAHKGQVDQQGCPYIHHVHRVANAVEGSLAKTVAWLHDVVEDTGISFDDLVTFGFSPEVIIAVKVVTRRAASVAPEGYREYINRVKTSGDQTAIQVKLADLRDNLRPGSRLPHLYDRYRAAIVELEPALEATR